MCPIVRFGSVRFGSVWHNVRCSMAEIINGIGATGPKRLRRLCEKELHLFMTRQHLANNARTPRSNIFSLYRNSKGLGHTFIFRLAWVIALCGIWFTASTWGPLNCFWPLPIEFHMVVLLLFKLLLHYCFFCIILPISFNTFLFSII